MDKAPSSEGDAMSIDEFVNNDDGLKKTTVNSAIQQLVTEGSLLRTGIGKKGSPFRYWRPEMLSFASKSDVTKERKLKTEEKEIQLPMLSFVTH
jgi:hypothetical protein